MTDVLSYSELSLESYKSVFNRYLDSNDKYSVIEFIKSEPIRRSIIGFFTTRSLSNLVDYLDINPNIRQFVLDYSDVFFFKSQEHYGVENKENIIVFLKSFLESNRHGDGEVSGSLLGKEVYSSYNLNVNEVINFITLNFWVVAYFMLFVNLDKLSDFHKEQEDKLNLG